MLLLFSLAPLAGAADWTTLEAGPVSASLGAARIVEGGWLWDGSASYLGDHLSVRLQGRSSGVVENWALVQTCDDDLPPFTTLLRNRGRADLSWATEGEGLRAEVGGVAQGIYNDEEVCAPFAFEESGASVEGFEFSQGDRIFWRVGGSGNLARWGDRGLIRLDLSVMRQVDATSQLTVYSASVLDESGEQLLSEEIDFLDDLLQSWSVSFGGVGKLQLLQGNLILRPEVQAERFQRTYQADSWSRRLEQSLESGQDLEESYLATWEETDRWMVHQRLELTLGQARFFGLGLRLWQSLDWTTEYPDLPALALGAGLRYGDDG